MTEKTINGVTFLVFELYKNHDWFRACFSTRIGGVSRGCFSSMNFRSKGDTKENIRENYRLFCSAASFTYEGLTFSCQEHGVNIRAVTKEDRGKGLHRERDYSNIDGLITNEPGIALTTFHADCAPVFLADPVSKAVGLIHAGWRGSSGEIAAVAVYEMAKVYGAMPENILAGIGPSICYACFEVDTPVLSGFTKFNEYVSKKPGSPGKYIIDLKGVNRQTLINSGLKAGNIEVSPLCTKCSESLFYSHRLSGERRGSMAAFMEIAYEK